MTVKQYTELGNYKLLDKIAQIDNKLDLVLEQFDLALKSNARLRKDLPEIITETIKTIRQERAIRDIVVK